MFCGIDSIILPFPFVNQAEFHTFYAKLFMWSFSPFHRSPPSLVLAPPAWGSFFWIRASHLDMWSSGHYLRPSPFSFLLNLICVTGAGGRRQDRVWSEVAMAASLMEAG